MQALVTGGTGLLGSNLVRLLVAEGHSVKVMARSAEKVRAQLGDLDVEVVIGDMADVPAFASELAGVDVVFHTAAYFREYFNVGDHWKTLEKINVEGTIQLLDAAEAHGVSKVIHVSSSGVIGADPSGQPSDESIAPDAHSMANLYYRSKVVAEERIATWLESHTTPVTLILPGAIFGPGDAGPTAAGRIITDFLNGKLPANPPGGFNVIDARDVAQAMLNAVEKGGNGERYIIGNRYAKVSEILGIVAAVSGRPKLRMNLPYPMAMVFATVTEWMAHLRGTEAQVTRNAMRTLQHNIDLNSNKARRELDLTPRPLEETFRDAVIWFAQNGYVQNELPALKSGQVASRAGA